MILGGWGEVEGWGEAEDAVGGLEHRWDMNYMP